MLIQVFIDDIQYLHKTMEFRTLTTHLDFKGWLFLGGAFPDLLQPDKALKTDPAGNRLPFWGDRHYTDDSYGNITEIKRGQDQALVQRLVFNAKHPLVTQFSHERKC